MNSVFSEQILADKLSKLNGTQQCIETLSHWCIFHRSKAEVVVTTWEKQFQSSEVAQKVPLLYLANDILQNSRKKGNEFVFEFWKVLPGPLKDLLEKGGEQGKKVVTRLVDIWEERKVFGSHANNIKELLLGEESPQPLEFTKKRPRSVKIVKRDSRSIRTKLKIGSTAERIVSAFHLVVSEHEGEDEDMNKCKDAVQRVKKLEKNIDLALTNAKDPNRKTLSKELEEEENVLKQCIEKLKVAEANRLALVSQLRDALNDQESELENVRTQMQVAQAQTLEAETLRKQLADENYTTDPKPTTTATSPPPPSPSPAATTDPKSKKSAADIAAEVADRLAASTSSQYIMSSVLSSFLTNTTNPPSQPEPLPYQALVMPSQPQYHTQQQQQQQYIQPSTGIVTSYAYANVAVPPQPQPQPQPQPPAYMMSPMVPLSHGQQPPAPATFRPPGMVFYGHPNNSQ